MTYKCKANAVILVTGGAGNLGLEAARAVLEHGASGVSLFDLNPAQSQEAIDALQSEFPDQKVITKKVNVADEDAIGAAVAETAKELGSVNILLCFAGVVQCMHAVDMSSKEWRRTLDINTTGSWLCAQAAARSVHPMQAHCSHTDWYIQANDQAEVWWQYSVYSLYLRPPCQLPATASGLQRIQRCSPPAQELLGSRMGPSRNQS